MLESVGAEDVSIDVLDFSETFSIYLYKHSISLTCTNLFRYCLLIFLLFIYRMWGWGGVLGEV